MARIWDAMEVDAKKFHRLQLSWNKKEYIIVGKFQSSVQILEVITKLFHEIEGRGKIVFLLAELLLLDWLVLFWGGIFRYKCNCCMHAFSLTMLIIIIADNKFISELMGRPKPSSTPLIWNFLRKSFFSVSCLWGENFHIIFWLLFL